jgi:cell division protein FtsB
MERLQMKKNHKIYKRLLILAIGIYVIFTLVNQQKTLNQYTTNSKELQAQINEQKEYKEQLAKKKNDVTSLDYVEQTAREKLDMYYPNERVYLDRGM